MLDNNILQRPAVLSVDQLVSAQLCLSPALDHEPYFLPVLYFKRLGPSCHCDHFIFLPESCLQPYWAEGQASAQPLSCSLWWKLLEFQCLGQNPLDPWGLWITLCPLKAQTMVTKKGKGIYALWAVTRDRRDQEIKLPALPPLCCKVHWPKPPLQKCLVWPAVFWGKLWAAW